MLCLHILAIQHEFILSLHYTILVNAFSSYQLLACLQVTERTISRLGLSPHACTKLSLSSTAWRSACETAEGRSRSVFPFETVGLRVMTSNFPLHHTWFLQSFHCGLTNWTSSLMGISSLPFLSLKKMNKSYSSLQCTRSFDTVLFLGHWGQWINTSTPGYLEGICQIMRLASLTFVFVLVFLFGLF